MEAYREGAFNKRKQFYGEEAALEWKANAIARHDAAKVVHRTRNEPRAPRSITFPDKSAKPLSGAA
jgi:hypothetical protein